LAGETEVLGENLPQYHFVHHKSHMTWDRTRAVAVRSQRLNRLSYGTALNINSLLNGVRPTLKR
jgi:hypothetical protein